MTWVIVNDEVYCMHRAPRKQWRMDGERLEKQMRGASPMGNGKSGRVTHKYAAYPTGVWTCGVCDEIIGTEPMVGDQCRCGAVVTTSRYREIRHGGRPREHGPGAGRGIYQRGFGYKTA